METLRRGGSPEGIVLEPDSATLAACGLDRSMSVWEHIWEDNAANRASFLKDREKIRDAARRRVTKRCVLRKRSF